MDNMRFILIMAIGLVTMILIQKWEEDYGTPEPAMTEQSVLNPDVPAAVELPKTPITEPVAPRSDVGTEANLEAIKTIQVKTDVFDLQIDLHGGTIVSADLIQYPVTLDEPDHALRLLDQSSSHYYVLKGGLISDQTAPNHQAEFDAENTTYELQANQEDLLVDLKWRQGTLEVIKRYHFKRSAYDFDIEYVIDNQSESSWNVRAYGQLQRGRPSSSGNRFIYTYTGGVLSTPDKRYEKISFDDMEDSDLETQVTDGWVAMLQHYFLSALIPSDQESEYYFYSKALKTQQRFILGMMTPAIDIPAGESGVLSHRAYIGPKIQDELALIAPDLDLTVDYGSLWFLAKPLYICLDVFHSLTGNWGWAILLVTLLLKIIFYPLSNAGYRSMANMRRIQPRMLALRDRYKDDKARLNQAMMEMYKTEKINPLGGCFPILIQIPVFIALYWVLLESVELRQAPFVLWISDLSSPDPFFILPIIMGATMYLQQKLNPAPMDPVQEKVMSFLPIIFTVFFAFFPSGLVLYWVANNILSILQQARINQNLEKAGLK